MALDTTRESNLAPAGIAPDLRAHLPRRLAWGGAIGATLFAAMLLAEPFRPEEAAGTLTGPLSALTGALLAAGVGWTAHTQKLSGQRLEDLAAIFHVGIGVVLWVMELAVPFAEATHTPGIPTAGGWLLFYPVLVPLSIRVATMCNLVVVLAGPLTLMGYIIAGQPTPPVGHATLWFVAAAFCGLASLITSNVLQRAITGLSDARKREGYVLLEQLGRGGMGEVFVARHERLARLAAVKRIRRDVLPEAQPLMNQRFELEAQITARLRSPHTVELYDYGVTEDGSLFYAMELLDGVDLHALVARFGPQSPARVAHMLVQICSSLQEAHEAGLIHRDIKPSNIMVCRLGPVYDVIKVLDFGTVKQDNVQEGSPVTERGQYVGTPAFSAPEQTFGDVSTASDIYALGCVAWWLLTGRRLFDTADATEVIRRHRTEQPPALSSAVPEVLSSAIRSCLEKEPDARPTAEEISRLLSPLSTDWSREQAEASYVQSIDRTAPAPATYGLHDA